MSVKDWFGRKADKSYTYYDEGKRLFNYGDDAESYSSFLMDGKDNDVKETAKLLGSMMRVVNVPKDFKITTQTKHENNSVQIPIQMIKTDDGSYTQDTSVVDAFFGASLQNAALATMQTPSEYASTIECRDTTSKRFTVKGYMTSLINTERIDKRFSDRFPGYTRFIQKFKDHAFDDKYTPLESSAPKSHRLLELVTKMIRYPKHVTQEELDEFKDPLEKIEKVFKKYKGVPETFAECDAMARVLSKIVIMEEDDKSEEPDDSEGEGDGDEGESEGKSKSKKPDPAAKAELEQAAKKMMESMLNPTTPSEDAATDDDALEDFKEAMDDDKPMHKFDDEGISESGSPIIFTYAKENKSSYIKVLEKLDMAKAGTLRNLFKRKSKDLSFVMKSMKSGRLDTNKLAEAAQNVSTIYERMGTVKTDKICVGVIVDESGSMGGHRIAKAKEAAIFVNEVFGKQTDVELFVYGHTADIGSSNSTDITVYKEPGKVMSKYALGSVCARANNRDGTAIYACSKRIRSFTKNQGIILVMSDGQPAAHNYNGRHGVEDTKKKVQMAEKLGFQVVQIAIEEDVPSALMFTNFIKMTNIETLPGDLTRYMSRKVDKLIRERVSI